MEEVGKTEAAGIKVRLTLLPRSPRVDLPLLPIKVRKEEM